MFEQENDRPGEEFVARNEAEAREIAARMGVTEACDEAPTELTEEELHSAAGGVQESTLGPENERYGPYLAGEKHFIKGDLYFMSDAKQFMTRLQGIFTIQRYMPGRNAPYLLKTNIGGVKATAIQD